MATIIIRPLIKHYQGFKYTKDISKQTGRQRKLMKIVAFDIGDKWTGVAISDALQMLARPLNTVNTHDLEKAISLLIDEEPIETFVVGFPKTMRGTESDQTKKLRLQFEKLELHFTSHKWVLWDERLTSKQAAKIKPAKSTQDKRESHSIAAALILGSYLEYCRIKREENL